MRKHISIAILITAAALGFRLFLALHLPNDQPDDGRIYEQIARNILDHRSYSVETEEPYTPTYIRVPGYPLFLAGVYRVFGDGNNRAVRVMQAVLDTLTCWVVALLALAWVPAAWGRSKQLRAMLLALALAASCPFPAIYVATILTETCATLLATACLLAATWAMRTTNRAYAVLWWGAAGLIGGILTLFRPDCALFVGACGLTLVVAGLIRAAAARRTDTAPGELKDTPLRILWRTLLCGAILSVGFATALAPWTIRNARVFGVFQPIAPANASMPGEFSPQGYPRWLRTWVDDSRYIEPLEFILDDQPILITNCPDFAFDSPEEKARVAALLDRYNHPQPETVAHDSADKPDQDKKEVVDPDDQPEEPDEQKANDNKANVAMTPEIDADFDALARERIARHPLRYYITLPVKRAISLWFDTHSQYYPFEGELFPLSDLDDSIHQQYWLPLFLFLTWAYTTLGFAGAWMLWASGGTGRRFLLLLALATLPRLAFLSSLENPEPRYVVEFFPLVIAAGSLALVKLTSRDSAPTPGSN